MPTEFYTLLKWVFPICLGLVIIIRAKFNTYSRRPNLFIWILFIIHNPVVPLSKFISNEAFFNGLVFIMITPILIYFMAMDFLILRIEEKKIADSGYINYLKSEADRVRSELEDIERIKRKLKD
jgi:hypothetical protein